MEAKMELVHFEYSMFSVCGRMASILVRFESIGFLHMGIYSGKTKKSKKMPLDQFKPHLLKIWDEIPDEVVRAACNNFQKRKLSCVDFCQRLILLLTLIA